MLLRLLFSTALVLLASLTMPPPHAVAQAGDADQPGMIPNPDDEQLDPRLQRQIVFFRSNEPPGTIIVHTSERFLYVVQPGGATLRHRRWPPRFSMAGPFEDFPQGGVAGLDAA